MRPTLGLGQCMSRVVAFTFGAIGEHDLMSPEQNVDIIHLAPFDTRDCCSVHKTMGSDQNFFMAKQVGCTPIIDQHPVLRRNKQRAREPEHPCLEPNWGQFTLGCYLGPTNPEHRFSAAIRGRNQISKFQVLDRPGPIGGIQSMCRA